MPLPIPAPRAEGATASTDVPLYWCAYGAESSPRLVVLHGGPGAHHEYLLPQMLALADRHELLFYDQRGGGRSRTDASAPITWRVHVDDLGKVIHELGAHPLTIVGYSWGAMLALLYSLEATRRDDLTPPARLVLIDPAPLSRTWREAFETEFARRQSGAEIARLRAELAASGLRERDPAAYRQRTFELSVAGYFAHPDRARDLTPFRVTARVQQSVWESLGDFDLIPLLSALRLPTLMVHGWADPIPADSTLAAARAMGARCVVLEGSGHVPYVERPDALFSAIGQFLEDTSSPGK
ncbi:MAG: alpha/beta fold hydrolase [Gemmatimonadaceae bacterium]|nr:alpha/beta fold hydrolase [Gemmatimonadaceae bacterium]